MRHASQVLSPPAPKAAKKSAVWFLFWAVIALVVIIFARWSYGIQQSLFYFSHKGIYQNQTAAEIENWNTVVRPLIDADQLFDVAVSVWVRREDAEQARRKQLLKEEHSETQSSHDYANIYRLADVQEQVIFSDIVFRGVSLKDTNLVQELELSIPVAGFKGAHHDELPALRASIVLVPQSPSLLEYVVDFKSAYATQRPRMRSNPFPLDSGGSIEAGTYEMALEASGHTFPLVVFPSVPRRCPLDDPESDLNPDTESIKHPYLVTRSQIRVAREDHVFNRKRFMQKYQELRGISCFKNWVWDRSCSFARLYPLVGHWERYMQLEVPNSSEGGTHTEWAYAPYIANVESGPKDLVRVPIDQENCPNEEIHLGDAKETENMNITWHVSFTGHDASKFGNGRFIIEHSLTRIDDYQPSNQYEIAHAQDKWEFWNGVLGHHSPTDSHPRRRMIFWVISATASSLIMVLDMLYWYTRRTTVGVSIVGVTASVVAILVGLVARILAGKDYFWYTVSSGLLASLQISRITGLHLSWSSSPVYFTSASHPERASRRLDLSLHLVDVLAYAIVFLSTVGLFGRYIISPFPIPSEKDLAILALYPYILALQVTGQIAQMRLNYKAQSFAGMYKPTAWLSLLCETASFVAYLPILVGRRDVTMGISVQDILRVLGTVVLCYQTVVYGTVKIPDDEEDE